MWNASEVFCRLNEPNSSKTVHVQAIKLKQDILYVQFTNMNTKAFHASPQKCVIQQYTVSLHTLINFRYLVGSIIVEDCYLNINYENTD